MQDRYDRCPNCMQGLPAMDDVCPYCGFGVSAYEEKPNCLKPFTVLQNKYMLGRVIGVGGFGITYIGWDLNLQTYIAIKEYYPDSLASRDISHSFTQVIPNDSTKDVYDKGLKRYVEEAQNLSKFYQLQGIVSVKDFFYENGTGYIVMEYINGINLKEYLNNAGGKLDEATVLALMKPALESLYQMHKSGLVHRDISPDNIMVDKDNKIKLIDFGSARGQSSETDKTYTVILKHGYAPAEQYYAKGNQGPWTDIYSLCATMYKMLTGQVPPNSVERMEQDDYINPTSMGVAVSQRTELVLRKGLAVKVSDRYQNIGELLTDLYGNTPIESIYTNPAGSAMPYNGSGTVGGSPVTMQSMYLNTPAVASKETKKNKVVIGIVAGVAALALIVGLVMILGKKDANGGGTTVADSTEVSTESTDSTTESEEYAYVAPAELSDDWRDYTVRIEDKLYQFPIPYKEFVESGWNSNQVTPTLSAGQIDDFFFYNDTIEMDVAIANYAMSEKPIEECFIIGFSITPDYDNVSESAQIELSGGIKWGEATEEQIKKTYGAPDNRIDGDLQGKAYVRLEYAGDNEDDGISLKLNENGVLYEIILANGEIPEGYEVGDGDIDVTPPEINSYYEKPSGQSADRFDGIITVDGFSVAMPVPVSEFTANGWSLSRDVEEYIPGSGSIETELEKEGNIITITVENFTTDAIMPVNGYITEISFEADYCSFDVVFPGGIKLGDTQEQFQTLYSDVGDDYMISEYAMFVSNYVSIRKDDRNDYVSCYSEPDTKVIYKLGYEVDVESIEP